LGNLGFWSDGAALAEPSFTRRATLLLQFSIFPVDTDSAGLPGRVDTFATELDLARRISSTRCR